MSKDFKIHADWKPTVEWLDKVKKGLDDGRPLFVAMRPKIIEWVQAEFTDSNPNKWASLTDRYRQWKIDQGYPETIGVLTGAMKFAASEGAIFELEPHSMSFQLDESQTPTKGGGSYASYFHYGTSKMRARPIYKRTRLVLKNWLEKDLQDLEGNKRSAFTFAWLEKALEPYRG